jgi:hypothetical protein
MHEHGALPRARHDGLLEEAVGEELLLYDQESHTAHCLSPIAACVWRHCDGKRDIAELARIAGASESLVAGALREMCEKDLFVAEPEPMQSMPGESRREAIGRFARYGAAATAGSLVVSATAATPAMAASEEIPRCCQCYEGTPAKECDCETWFSEPSCQEYCEKSGKCTKGFGSKISGTTCNKQALKCK